MARYPTAPGVETAARLGATIDYSNANEGYVIVTNAGYPDKKCKVRILKESHAQNFSLPNELVPQAKTIPLCFGNGLYEVQVYRQTTGTFYEQILAVKRLVNLNSPLAPFLYPNTYAEYTPASKCVAKAGEVCTGKVIDVERLATIFRWIVEHTEYDPAFADLAREGKVDGWWLPNPDDVLKEGKTICLGYTSLMAAMCRSQGVPAKLVVGRISSGALHAWNEVWVENTGTVGGIPLKAKSWTRIDVTNLDGSGERLAAYVQNDANYTMEYCG